MTIATMRDLRANMKAYFNAIAEDSEILLVPRQGNKEAVVIMTLAEYNSMAETEYLLSTEKNRNMFEQAKDQLESGDVVHFEPKEI